MKCPLNSLPIDWLCFGAVLIWYTLALSKIFEKWIVESEFIPLFDVSAINFPIPSKFIDSAIFSETMLPNSVSTPACLALVTLSQFVSTTKTLISNFSRALWIPILTLFIPAINIPCGFDYVPGSIQFIDRNGLVYPSCQEGLVGGVTDPLGTDAGNVVARIRWCAGDRWSCYNAISNAARLDGSGWLSGWPCA